MFNNNLFAKNIRNYREKFGQNAYDFAIQANINYKTLTNIECCYSTPSIDTALHILNYLNIGFNECLNEQPTSIQSLYFKNLSKSLNDFKEIDLEKLLVIAKNMNGKEDLYV